MTSAVLAKTPDFGKAWHIPNLGGTSHTPGAVAPRTSHALLLEDGSLPVCRCIIHELDHTVAPARQLHGASYPAGDRVHAPVRRRVAPPRRGPSIYPKPPKPPAGSLCVLWRLC
eukprot:gene17030-biopygen2292